MMSLDIHRETLEGHIRQHPPFCVPPASDRIDTVTGLKRSPRAGTRFHNKIGVQCRKAGMIPAKAHPANQDSFKKTRQCSSGNQNLVKAFLTASKITAKFARGLCSKMLCWLLPVKLVIRAWRAFRLRQMMLKLRKRKGEHSARLMRAFARVKESHFHAQSILGFYNLRAGSHDLLLYFRDQFELA